MENGWTLEQWLEGFERNVEGHIRHTVQTAQQAAPTDDPTWVELRQRYRVAADPLIARWVASLNPTRPRGASSEELRLVLEALSAWAMGELQAFRQQAKGVENNLIFQRIYTYLTQFPLQEIVRYREALVASSLGQPAAGAAPAVGGIFANAAKTAAETPWAATYQQGAQANTLVCMHCGSAQERPLDFLCRYCRKPLG